MPDARPSARASVALLATAAATLPSLLAYNVSPSPTFLNQALAFGLWAGFVAISASGGAPRRSAWPLYAALGVLVLAVLWSWGLGALPASLALSGIGTLFAALVMVTGGAGASHRTGPAYRSDATEGAVDTFVAFCWAWLVAGALNVALALAQVFLPGLPDGDWIAASGMPGRAVGNLRQPNHLSSLLLWSCIAVLALHELGRLRRAVAAALLAALVFAVVLTASRTGLVSVLLLAAWGLLDRKLSRSTRALLLAVPLVYLASWWGLAQWAALTEHNFAGSARLAETDISGSRFGIWRDTLALIRMHPWTGVGFGEFNFAWTLTPFPQRPTAFFDHTHNLPLQLAVELGLPLAALVLALLCWALWRGWRGAWAAPGATGTARRSAMLMVAMIGLHSLLEYPLWYSYFLLPAAWAWGHALQDDNDVDPAKAPQSAARSNATPWVAGAALAVMAGALLSVADYWRVAVIFSADDDAPPLEQRIAAGQRSLFFAHHADYAEVTSGVRVADPARAFDRVTHYLLDTRLMTAWARSLAARGEVDAARHLAARLREFRKGGGGDFFEACPDAEPPAPGSAAAAASALPFQCEPPRAEHRWQDFLAPGAR